MMTEVAGLHICQKEILEIGELRLLCTVPGFEN